MDFRQSATDVAAKGMNLLHQAILKLSGGRVLNTAFGMPTLELHTVGRKSGKPRTTMLTTPIHDEQRVVLVASKGGDERDPEWFLNAMAHPDVELVLHGQTLKMHARSASAEERAELWPQVVARYQGYGGYQQRTTREIPLVICEPRPA